MRKTLITIQSTAFICGLLSPLVALAGIPEPSIILHGNAEIGGSQAIGMLEARRGGNSIVSSPLSGNPYVLIVPVIKLLPGETGLPNDVVQIGDQIDLYVNGIDTGTTLLVSDRGTVSEVDLSIAGFIRELAGVASGGSISITINNVPLVVNTNAGQTAEDVVLALVADIQANSSLATVAATATGGIFTTNGNVSSFTINDSGLN